MTILAHIAIALTLLALALSVLKRALVFQNRQAIFRLRDRIYIRVLKGELRMEDPAVRHLVEYLNSLIYVIDDWSLVRTLQQLKAADTESVPWLNDERLKQEALHAVLLTLSGLWHVSFLFKLMIVIGIPWTFMHGTLERWKGALLRTVQEYPEAVHQPA